MRLRRSVLWAIDCDQLQRLYTVVLALSVDFRLEGVTLMGTWHLSANVDVLRLQHFPSPVEISCPIGHITASTPNHSTCRVHPRT